MKLVSVKARDLSKGDVARGVNHSRIVTGPPVRVINVRPIGDDRVRVSYVIIGIWSNGWRDIEADRTVTVEREGK